MVDSLLGYVEPDDFIAIIAVGGSFLTVFIGLLLRHQRKMTEFLHRVPETQGQQAQIDGLELEVRELKDRINHLILQNEDKRELSERVGPPRIPDHLR